MTESKRITNRNLPPPDVPDITIVLVHKKGEVAPLTCSRDVYLEMLRHYYRAVLMGESDVTGPEGTKPYPIDRMESDLHNLAKAFAKAMEHGIVSTMTEEEFTAKTSDGHTLN